MNEFELIRRYFRREISADWCRLGIGDDAAVIRPPQDEELVITSDTLNDGRHFPSGTAPGDIGWKALAVNLSDLAAMGARPMGCLLNLSLPEADERFVDAFASGFFALAARHEVELVGGDTTRGPLSISVTAFGCQRKSRLLRRDTARPKDVIVVAGKLGGAALALRQGAAASPALRECLDRPRPMVEEGLRLAGEAHAAIDISDGLAADLGHILDASGLGAELDLSRLPLHPEVAALGAQQACKLALHGGDDYALLATMSRGDYERLSAELPLQCIGAMRAEPGLFGRDAQGELTPIERAGFLHFT